MASSSSSGLQTPANGGGGDIDVMMELEELRQLETWKSLVAWVISNLKTSARQALSHHMSTPCQPGKHNGPCISLKVCGLDDEHRTPAEGGGARDQWHVEMDIPNAYKGEDGFRLQYRSAQCDNKKEAQMLTCVDLLCFLLVSNTVLVKLHISNWKLVDSVVTLTGKATEVQLKRQGPFLTPLTPNSLAYRSWVQENRTHQSSVLQPRAVHEPRRAFDDISVVQIMRLLRHGTVYGPGAGAFPPEVGTVIERLLPKGGLLPFLQRHPDLFVLHVEGSRFTFQCTPAIGVPAIDIQVSASGAPADGGSQGEIGIPPGLGHVNTLTNAPVKVSEWSVQHFVDFLVRIELPHLEPIVRHHGINGALWLNCQLPELTNAGFSELQVKKILGSFPTTYRPE
jgi:hypothetical protein